MLSEVWLQLPVYILNSLDVCMDNCKRVLPAFVSRRKVFNKWGRMGILQGAINQLPYGLQKFVSDRKAGLGAVGNRWRYSQILQPKQRRFFSNDRLLIDQLPTIFHETFRYPFTEPVYFITLHLKNQVFWFAYYLWTWTNYTFGWKHAN